MTKKHMEWAASYLRQQTHGVNPAAEAFAAFFAEFNPRFDRERFFAAVRGEDSTDSAGRTVRYSVLKRKGA